MCGRVCVCALVCIHGLMEAIGWHLSLQLYFLSWSLSLNLELTKSARLAGYKLQGFFPLCFHMLSLDAHVAMPIFLHGS